MYVCIDGCHKLLEPPPGWQGAVRKDTIPQAPAVWKGTIPQAPAHGAKGNVYQRIRVTTCGSQETESLHLSSLDTTVLHIKENLVGKWFVPVDKQVLVCCGEVLEDHVQLNQIMEQLQQEATLWLVLRNAGQTMQVEKCDVSAMLPSIFALSGSRQSKITSHQQCIATFSVFCDIYGQAHVSWRRRETRNKFQILTWTPSIEQTAALAGAQRALRNGVSSDFQADFPQLSWFPDYGCALMATCTSEGNLSLQVACLFPILPLPYPIVC